MPWWLVLEVPRGSDRATIRRAYARRLKVTNPEDDSQGFMALREAYETALNWVDFDNFDEWDAAEDRDVAPDAAQPSSDVAQAPIPPGPPAFAPEMPVAVDSQPIEPDPVAPAHAHEHAELRELTAALESGLRGPWFADATKLKFYFGRIRDAGAMIEIDTRDRIEHWLADLLADTIPRSDPILMRAIDTFDWAREGNRPAAVWTLLGRIDEWRMIEAFGTSGNALAAGWQALTRSGVPGWRRRIDAFRPGLAGQVRELFDLADYQAPGIAHSFDPQAVAWWRAHLETPRLGFVDLLALVFTALVASAFIAFEAAPVWQIGGALTALAAGLAFPLVRMRAILPLRARLEYDATLPPWWSDGWFNLWFGATFMLIAFPIAVRNAVIVSVLSGLAALWMLVVSARAPRIGNPLGKVFAFGGLALVGWAGFWALAVPERAALAVYAAASLLIAWLGGAAIARFIRRHSGEPDQIAIGIAVVLLVGASIRALAYPAPLPLVPWGAAAIAGMVLISAAYQDGTAMRLLPWLRWGLWIALVAAAVLSAPRVDQPDLPLSTRQNPIERLEAAQPGFAALQTGNPALHAAIVATLQAQSDGKLTATQAGQRIDAIVTAAYRVRLPYAPAALIAAEYDIRLATLRELQASDQAACARGSRDGDGPPLSAGLKRRYAAQALAVAASTAASERDKAAGREIGMEVLRQTAAGGDTATLARQDAALSGRDPKAKCAARIALLEALVAQSDDDIAKTMRPALITQAAGDSAKNQGRQAP